MTILPKYRCARKDGTAWLTLHGEPTTDPREAKVFVGSATNAAIFLLLARVNQSEWTWQEVPATEETP